MLRLHQLSKCKVDTIHRKALWHYYTFLLDKHRIQYVEHWPHFHFHMVNMTVHLFQVQ